MVSKKEKDLVNGILPNIGINYLINVFRFNKP